MSGRAFQAEGLQCPALRLEHRVGWNKSKKTEAVGTDHADGKLLGSENWSDLGCVWKACTYSSQGCMVGLS